MRRAQPVVVERLVADQGLKIEAGDQGLDADAVVTLAGQQDEANEIAEDVDQGHDLGSQAAMRATYGLILSPPFCAGAMLVDPDECAVDEDIFEIGIVARVS